MEIQKWFATKDHTISSNGTQVVGPSETQIKSEAHHQSIESPSARRVPDRGQEEMSGVILKMQKDLFTHGKQRAIARGTLEPHDEDVQALESHASAIAREAHRDVYDPTQHAHDQLLDNEYNKKLADRADAEQAEKYASAALREREEEAAQAQAGTAPAEHSLALPIAAVIAIMITVAPTLHDFVFIMTDEFMSWMLSLLSGLFLGLLITLMILGDVDASGRRTTTNWIGLSAGIFMSLALGALRVKGAKDSGDYIFAAAMTVLELGIVIGLEGIAKSRRAARQDWAGHKAVADQANARLEMAQTNLERWKDRLRELNNAINGHINYVEEREFRYLRIDEIEATALKAVRDGYQAGVAENRGRILGIGGNSHE
jgi:hypothetical protein